MVNKKFCTNCGSKVSSTTKFCKECGDELIVEKSKIATQTITPKIPESQNELRLLIIIKQYFKGDISLLKSYFFIALPSQFISRVIVGVFPIVEPVMIPIVIFISIGLWRSAGNYIKKTKGHRKFWGYLAKVIAAANIIIIFNIISYYLF